MSLRRFQYSNKKLAVVILSVTICCILTAVLTSFTFYIFTIKEFHNNIQIFMSDSSATLENRIDSELWKYLYDNLERYIRPSNYSLFFESTETDLDYLMQIRICLTDSLRFQDNVSDLVLYRADDGTAVSASNSGYKLEKLSSYYNNIQSIEKIDGFIRPRFHIVGQDAKDKNIIAFLYPVVNPNRWTDGTAYRGFAALIIEDPSSFFHTDVEDLNSSGTFLVANEYSVLLAEGANTLSDDVIFDILDSQSDGKIRNSKIQSVDYTYCSMKSPKNNNTYLYYEHTPNLFQFLSKTHNYIYTFLYLLTIVILVFIYSIIFLLITKKQYVIIHQKNAVEKMKSKMEKANQPSMEILKEKFLSLDGKYNCYSMIILEPDPYYVTRMSKNQREFLNETLIECIIHFFNQLELPHIVSRQAEGLVSCIVNYDKSLDIRELLSKFPDEFAEFTKCGFNIFYTKSYSSKEQTVESYSRLLQLTKYSFLYNYSNLFSLDQLEKIERNRKAVDTMTIETVQAYLRDMEPDKFIEYLNRTVSSIRTNGYSYNQTIDFFNTVFCSLKDFFAERAMDEPANLSLFELMKKFRSMDECVAFINTYLNTYKDNLSTNHTFTNKRNMESIIKFIDDNIEEVTLTAVAEEFHITSAHLSRIFKDHAGINFSDYVTKRKLLRATQLLKENTNLSIVDIANKLGYNTASYFSSKFKEHFGVTPSAYKKNIMRNQ